MAKDKDDTRQKDYKSKLTQSSKDLLNIDRTDLSDDPKIHEKVRAKLNGFFKSDVASAGKAKPSKVYSTGILSLDRLVGNGGILTGRFVSSHGREGTGKTMTAMTVAGAIQRAGGKCAYVDSEGTYDPTFSMACGLDPDDLQLIQSTREHLMTGEDFLSTTRLLIEWGYNFIIIDSSAALVPGKKLTEQFGEGQAATSARMLSEELPKIVAQLNSTRSGIVWMINQIRQKPMVMFGPTEGATGGEAQKFYASYNLDIRKKGDIEKNVLTHTGAFEKMIIGVRVAIYIEKNKTARLASEPIEFDVYTAFATDDEGNEYKPGVDVDQDTVSVGIASGVVAQNSSWYSFGGVRGNGKKDFSEALRKSPTDLAALRAAVLGVASAPMLSVVKDAAE